MNTKAHHLMGFQRIRPPMNYPLLTGQDHSLGRFLNQPVAGRDVYGIPAASPIALIEN
jgi:hypothetical protein